VSEWGARVFGHFVALDRALVAKGFPPTSPWWLATIERFLLTGKRQLVVRAGRRAGKSSTMARLAVCTALYGEHVVPPGDIGIVAFISTTRDEAAQRLRTIEAILDALRIKRVPIENGCELPGRRVGFKVFACSVASVSGFTGIACIADEVAKWRDSDTGANPAREVLAAARPTMATQPNARMFLISSPLATLDLHHDTFEQGSTDFQEVAHAETWVANPTLTEADTHALEPDHATWSREYAAIPATELSESLLSVNEVDGATRDEPADLAPFPGAWFCAIDPATRGDAWTLVVAGRSHTSRVVRIAHAAEWQGTKANPLSPEAVFADIATRVRPYNIRVIHSDQASADALTDIASRVGLQLVCEPATATLNLARADNFRTRLRTGEVELAPVANLRTDLLNVRRLLTRSGVTILLPRIGGRHCDFAPPVFAAVQHLGARSFGPLHVPNVESREARWDSNHRGF
jgi:hypothetical protein